jgi:oxygen-independent coproporphyrinogen-3 oxidase
VVNRYAPVASYLELVEREIGLVSGLLKPGQRVTNLHWGGGSPTMLRPEDVANLSGALRRHFTISPDAEFAVEIDPRGFRKEMAEVLAAAGVTRTSIGVQDCDPTVQRAINRMQPVETTGDTVDMLRSVGIKALNIDLIYGLPHQTISGLEKTIDEVLTFEPERLAIFGYAHMPHFKKHQSLIPERALPDPEERFRQAEAANARLRACGYMPIGLDHFAKPTDSMAIAQREGRLSRNFQGYTTDDAHALIGLGASSIGSLPNGYVQNITEVPGYRSTVLSGRLPVARGVALTNEDRARRAVIERLMCDLQVDLPAVASAFGLHPSAFEDSIRALDGFEKEGAILLEDGRITILPPWRSATRLVCAAFDAYLDNGVGRHAVAV